MKAIRHVSTLFHYDGCRCSRHVMPLGVATLR